MNKARITCPICGKRMYSLGYARHRAMHRDENKETARIDALKNKFKPAKADSRL